MRFVKAVVFGVLALCAPACAEIMKFDMISLDVPAGWTAEQQGVTVVMKARDSDASLSLASSGLGEATLEDVAKKLYEQLGGVDFEKDEDGDFYFEYRDIAGVKCGVWVCAGDEGEYMVVAASGEDQPGGEMIDHILSSVRYRSPEDEEGGEDEDGEEGDDEEEWEDDDQDLE